MLIKIKTENARVSMRYGHERNVSDTQVGYICCDIYNKGKLIYLSHITKMSFLIRQDPIFSTREIDHFFYFLNMSEKNIPIKI